MKKFDGGAWCYTARVWSPKVGVYGYNRGHFYEVKNSRYGTRGKIRTENHDSKIKHIFADTRRAGARREYRLPGAIAFPVDTSCAQRGP